MALLKCDICGGKIQVQEGGQIGMCDSCGATYTIERMREIVSGAKVSVTGTQEDVEQWKTLVKTYLKSGDFNAVEGVVKKILGAVPSDEYANDIYSKLQDWKFYEIKNGVLIKYTGKAKDTTIPNSVTSIDDSAFEDCTSLTSITIPDSVTSIGHAFKHCKSLTSVTIPDSITNIDIFAFYGCKSLTDITIPDSVTSIGDVAFNGCKSLSSVTIPNSVTSIGTCAFGGCERLTSITIPDSVTSIGNGAFNNCKSLTSITIPDSVISIGNNAFENCTNLSNIIVNNNPNVSANNFCGTLWYETRMQERKSQELCQHCGGNFKGIFNKVCSKCGKPKDY